MRKFLALALAWALVAAVPAYAETVSAPAISLPVSVANGGTGITAWSNFRISRSSDQTGIVSATPTTVAFNSAATPSYDTASLCNLTTGVCTVNRAGTWHFDVSLLLAPAVAFSTSAFTNIAFYKNGATIVGRCYMAQSLATNATAHCSANVALAASDTIELKVNASTSSSTFSAIGGANALDSWMDGGWVGP